MLPRIGGEAKRGRLQSQGVSERASIFLPVLPIAHVTPVPPNTLHTSSSPRNLKLKHLSSPSSVVEGARLHLSDDRRVDLKAPRLPLRCATRVNPVPLPREHLLASEQMGEQVPSANKKKKKRGRKLVATKAFTGQSPSELSFNEGATIRLHKNLTGDWWYGSLDGKRGKLPVTHVRLLHDKRAGIVLYRVSEGQQAIALYNFSPKGGDELGFKTGDILTFSASITGAVWCMATVSGGRKGMVPLSLVRLLPDDDATSKHDDQQHEDNRSDSLTGTEHVNRPIITNVEQDTDTEDCDEHTGVGGGAAEDRDGSTNASTTPTAVERKGPSVIDDEGEEDADTLEEELGEPLLEEDPEECLSDKVEMLVDHRTKGGVVQFRAHWYHSAPCEDEWFDTRLVLQDYPVLVREYEQRLAEEGRAVSFRDTMA